MFPYVLVCVMVASLVYIIFMLGEYRPFVEATELKMVRLEDSISRLEREMEEDGRKLEGVQELLTVAIDRHDDLQQEAAAAAKLLREAKLLETRLEAEKNRQDYKRTR